MATGMPMLDAWIERNGQPTAELREYLAEQNEGNRPNVTLERLLDEIDRQAAWHGSQNELNRGRVEHLRAELRAGRMWRAVDAISTVLRRVADTADAKRRAAVQCEIERGRGNGDH